MLALSSPSPGAAPSIVIGGGQGSDSLSVRGLTVPIVHSEVVRLAVIAMAVHHGTRLDPRPSSRTSTRRTLPPGIEAEDLRAGMGGHHRPPEVGRIASVVGVELEAIGEPVEGRVDP